MKGFLDMEFTGLHQNTTLVSLGLVMEDGRKFYAEFMDYDKNQVDDFVQEHVINHLWKHNVPDELTEERAQGRFHYYVCNRPAATRYLMDFLEEYDFVEIWGDTLAYDWMLFCNLFQTALLLPKKIYYIPFDIATLFYAKGIDPDITREEFAGVTEPWESKHNSLWDAYVIMHCHAKLTNAEVVDTNEKSEYGGTKTVMNTLPIGTAFYVHNGHWNGVIGEKDGEKVIITGDDDFLKIGNTYALRISIK